MPRPPPTAISAASPTRQGSVHLGEDRSRAVAAAPLGAQLNGALLKPPPDRLYGRARGHALRPRQRLLLDVTLPRLRFSPGPGRGRPARRVSARPGTLWLEVGFGGGEHALAQVAASPEAGLIACEVFENGICSLLSRLVAEGGEADAPLPPNLRLWAEDARVLLRILPDACLDRLFLLFPDPWPKARHAKRRFVHPALLPDAGARAAAGGDLAGRQRRPDLSGLGHRGDGGAGLFDAPPPVAARPEDGRRRATRRRRFRPDARRSIGCSRGGPEAQSKNSTSPSFRW